MKKVALVTGASRGIGNAAAQRLAADGFAVAVNYQHSEQQAKKLVDLITQNGGHAAAFCANVSDRQQVDGMLIEIEKNLGSVDVLVNNAGIAQQKLFTDITEQDWSHLFAVNVGGVFHCCQAVLPAMIHQKSGRIINISSIWGITGASCEVHYSASKAAIIGFTKALAKELGPSGIQVNCIAPGVIETEMNANLDAQTIAQLKDETPLGVIGKPSDIAAVISFLAGEQSGFITGQVISPNGGLVI